MWFANRLISCCVAVALATVPVPSLAYSPAEDVEKMYAEGDASFANGDYLGAARIWAEALNQLEETDETNATRAQILVASLTAYLEAFVESRKIEQLRDAARLLERYAASLENAYQDDAELSAAVIDMKRRLNRALENAEEARKENEAKNDPPPPDPQPTTKRDDDDQTDHPPSAHGRGLLIGGVAATAASLGTGALIVIGALKGMDSEDIINDENSTQDKIDQAKIDGPRANKMAIVGAVVTPILLGAGIAMIVMGAKRNVAHTAFVPLVGPGFAGVGISGRF